MHTLCLKTRSILGQHHQLCVDGRNHDTDLLFLTDLEQGVNIIRRGATGDTNTFFRDITGRGHLGHHIYSIHLPIKAQFL